MTTDFSPGKFTEKHGREAVFQMEHNKSPDPNDVFQQNSIKFSMK